jgi:hypothetical protein
MMRASNPIHASLRRHLSRWAGTALAATAALAVAACGASSHSGDGQAQGTAASAGSYARSSAPLTVGTGIGGAGVSGQVVSGAAPEVTARYRNRSSNVSSRVITPALRASKAPSHAYFARTVQPGPSEQTKPSKSNFLNPCRLISRAAAESVFHTRFLASTEAPMGPSCVYASAHHGPYMSVVVDPTAFSKLPKHMSSLRKFSGARWQGYCGGTKGASVLYVRFNANEVLHITGPCLTVAKLVPGALTRLRTTPGLVPVTP